MNRPPQPHPVTIYLGTGEERERNIETLKRIASKYTHSDRRSKNGNISQFIQRIIKGELIIIDPDQYHPT